MDKKTKMEVFQKYQQVKNESKSFINNISRDWQDRINKMKGILDGDIYNSENKKDWQSQKCFNHTKTTVDILIGRVDNIEFPAPSNFSNISVSQMSDNNGQRIATALQQLTEQLIYMGGFWDIKKTLITESVIFGGSFIKIIYDKKEKTLKYYWRTIQNSYPDPSAVGCFDNSMYHGEWYNELMGDVVNNTVYDKSARDRVKNEFANQNINSTSSSSSKGHDFRDNVKTIELNDYSREHNIMPTIKIDEFRIKWFNSSKNKMDWVKINVIDNTDIILSCDWYEDGLMDTVFFPYAKRMYSYLGDGVVTKDVMDLQDGLNDALNIGLDNAKLALAPLPIIERSMISNNEDVEVSPGSPMIVPDGTGDKLNVVTLAAPNYQSLIQYQNSWKEAIEETIGITRESTGGTIRSSERSAEQAALRQASSEKRMLSRIREFEEGTIKMIAKTVYAIKKKLPQSTIDKILGFVEEREQGYYTDDVTGRPTGIFDDTVKRPRLLKKELEEFIFDYRVQGVESFEGQKETTEKIMNVISLSQMVPELNEKFDIPGLAETLVLRSRIPDIERYAIESRTDEQNVGEQELIDLGTAIEDEALTNVTPETSIQEGII